MTDESCRPMSIRSDATHRYCLRVPSGTPVPQGWIDSRETDGEFDFIETVPVPVMAMHEFAAQNPRAFFAGIEKGL